MRNLLGSVESAGSVFAKDTITRCNLFVIKVSKINLYNSVLCKANLLLKMTKTKASCGPPRSSTKTHQMEP